MDAAVAMITRGGCKRVGRKQEARPSLCLYVKNRAMLALLEQRIVNHAWTNQ